MKKMTEKNTPLTIDEISAAIKRGKWEMQNRMDYAAKQISFHVVLREKQYIAVRLVEESALEHQTMIQDILVQEMTRKIIEENYDAIKEVGKVQVEAGGESSRNPQYELELREREAHLRAAREEAEVHAGLHTGEKKVKQDYYKGIFGKA